MAYQLETKLPPTLPLVEYGQAGGVMIGSCFASEIGERLHRDRFLVSVNPFGTAFNPKTAMGCVMEGVSYHDSSLVEGQTGLWYSYRCHSDVWGETKDHLLTKLAMIQSETVAQILTARWMSITLGTAWVYVLKYSGQLVGNNHKQPTSLFDRCLLSVNEIQESFSDLVTWARSLNPDIQFLLTVSPVIHGRDQLSENSLSKAVLRVAAGEMAMMDGVHYFPSLEIVRDELRDYRFYAEDMQHPSKQACDVVYEKFLATYLGPGSTETLQDWRKLRGQLEHRPRQPGSANHLKQVNSMREQLLTKAWPFDVTNWVERLSDNADRS